MDIETLKILTCGLDHLQRGLAILETAGYDTSDIQDGVNHLVADIKEGQLPPLVKTLETITASEWLTSDAVSDLLAKFRADDESVYASGKNP